MNDVAVIDRFLDVFSRYIDSGFGLLHGEVAFLTATLVVIDMTLAGLFWAMSHASGQGDDVIARFEAGPFGHRSPVAVEPPLGEQVVLVIDLPVAWELGVDA